MSNFQLSEKDVEYLFGGKKKRKIILFKEIFFYFVVFLLIFASSYVLINFPALKSIVSFWYGNEIIPNDENSPGHSASVININSKQNSGTQGSSIPSMDDNSILIPKIKSNAPVSWQVRDSESEIQSNLEKGVVHLAGTALPGQTGNVFITGHSSNYFWAKGNYKNIFALLGKLVVGDYIYLKYQKVIYTYRVDNVHTVKPNDVSVMQQSKNSELTLMTCTPVGTSINRLIVHSVQINPDTGTNSDNSKNAAPNSLPQGVR